MKKSIVLTIILILSNIVCASPEPEQKSDAYKLNPDYAYCNDASDCEDVYTHCGGCECGTPINKKYIPEVRQSTSLHCANYQGNICQMGCFKTIMKCENNKCLKELDGDPFF